MNSIIDSWTHNILFIEYKLTQTSQVRLLKMFFFHKSCDIFVTVGLIWTWPLKMIYPYKSQLSILWSCNCINSSIRLPTVWTIWLNYLIFNHYIYYFSEKGFTFNNFFFITRQTRGYWLLFQNVHWVNHTLSCNTKNSIKIDKSY